MVVDFWLTLYYNLSMENISEKDLERCIDILNNTGGIIKQNKLKQPIPQEQEIGIKMWNEVVRYTNKQLEEIIPILKEYNETNKK